MLTLEKDADDALVLVSDDKNAENVAISDAIEAAAPELLEAWTSTKVGDDGTVRFRVLRQDWESLADAMEELSCMIGVVSPDQMIAVERTVREALG